MEYIKLKTLEGLNIYGKKNTIYIKVEKKYKEDLYRVIEKYKYFTKSFNIISEVQELKSDENYIEVCFICNRVEISKYILDNLFRLENNQHIEQNINEEILKRINDDWSYLIQQYANTKGIPFIKINEDELQLGYGINSKRITKKDYKKYKKFEDINLKENGFIPLISVTGTNGKTTTVRLIHNILLELGYNSGLSSTGGIYIGNKLVRHGDTTGFYSAREVLKDNSVEIAVLETARGGILKKGLGYEAAKIAIITSISEDHIGSEGIRNQEDLVNIKGVVAQELQKDGILIIRGIDILADKYKNKKNVIMFEYEKNNNIKLHLKNNKKAYYVENNKIIRELNGEKVELMDVRNIPFTFYGASKSNTKNVIAAIAAINELHSNSNEIKNVLQNIKCDINTNLGRQNLIDFEKFKLIIDYGHNSEAFKEVFSIVKAMNAKKVTVLITAPGDREDKYIRELGYITAKVADKIIIKEQPDLRDRNIGETAMLLKEGVLECGFDEKNINIILQEEDAILKALNEAVEGEIIVSFSQFLYLTFPAINKFRLENGLEPIGEGIDLAH